MIFKAKPRTVEAQWVSDDPDSSDMTKIKKWLADHGFNGGFMADRGALAIYRGRAMVAHVSYGRWLVILGNQDVQVLKPELFNQTYEWTGPKVYADAPYLVN